MKLSLIFELLLIFILLAFAASKSVGHQKNNNKKKQFQKNDNSLNSYCKCSELYCDCCRDFSVPLVNLDGPGCAKLSYLNGDKMAVSLSFGKKVISNKVLASRKPSPVCMPLPGGISKFCGRVYNIARSGEEFRACLGLELQAKKTVEAAVRVSCFKFGPRGVSMEPADPLPLVPQGEKNDDDDDDDDDDEDYGLGDDDDDADFAGINDVDSADYTGFSLLEEDLLGDLFGESTSGSKKTHKIKKKQAPPQSTTTTTTTRRPRPRRTTKKPSTVTVRPVRSTTVRVRPVSRRTRRPSRRPGSRPSRRPISSTTELTTSSYDVTSTTQASTLPISSISPVIPSTERNIFISTIQEESLEPVAIVTQRPTSALPSTSSKPSENFADPGLEMSLAHITGQLSAMPVASIIPDDPKENALASNEEQITFHKIETITPKASTIAYQNDDSVRIVSSLDSEEHVTEMEPMAAEESRAHYEGLTIPRQNNDGFAVEDLDVLDLESIGESVGDQLGLFEKNKRKNRNKPTKIQKNKKKNEGEDYDILGLDQISEVVGDSIGMFGRSHKNGNKKTKLLSDKEKQEENLLEGINTLVGDAFSFDRSDTKNKKDRRRQNKMMKEWSQN